MCSILRNFKNESKSQLLRKYNCFPSRCVQYYEISKMKANHNCVQIGQNVSYVVFNTTKFQKWKQITTYCASSNCDGRCVQYYEISKMKANHNTVAAGLFMIWLCSILRNFKNESKSQPPRCFCVKYWRCVQYYEISKMKANHNIAKRIGNVRTVVFNTTKFQKWKQITTNGSTVYNGLCCVQYYEISKMKANHNESGQSVVVAFVVFNTTKFQKWKQITTYGGILSAANALCSILRNFKNESKSQHIIANFAE